MVYSLKVKVLPEYFPDLQGRQGDFLNFFAHQRFFLASEALEKYWARQWARREGTGSAR
jgi:hypothetical protein